MSFVNVRDIIKETINCEPGELRQHLDDWLLYRSEHKRGKASKSKFIEGLHLAVFYQIIEDLGKDEIYITA